ncbi:oxidoreductase [Klebsiella pneumoniae]|uniref:Oxidoreductase n=1 Tax=Klebsiella pneumoniae TaxID=573 RepID=A0A377TRJ2_KLEPN|nr:oxidoreductase [Klebsiella pneumoniae]
MEPRRVNGKNHWYHETQSTICPVDVLPLVPEAAHVEDRFLLDLTLPPPGYVPTLTGYTPHASWPNCCFPTRWR